LLCPCAFEQSFFISSKTTPTYGLQQSNYSGRLTRDPELRTLSSGQHVCEFTVATNRAYTDAGGTKQEEVVRMVVENLIEHARGQAEKIVQGQ
jgi:single-stranded DNA-binding protein